MRFRQKTKKLAVLFLTCSVMFTEAFACGQRMFVSAKPKSRASAKTSGQAQGVNVTYHSKDDIIKYIKANGAEVTDPLEFSQNPVTVSPYDPGKLSDQTQQSALNMLKQMRYIAGISDQVELSDDLSGYAQAAAFLNYVNGKLSHNPTKPSDMDDALYQKGYQGAGSSNIAWASRGGASLNETIAFSWMKDDDPSNINRVGHRRWMLNPQMGKTGFGAVSGSKGTYSSVYAFDTSNSSALQTGVAWPAQNMPVEYFDVKFPWSISMGHKVDADKIKVTLTRKSDGHVWTFSDQTSGRDFYVDNGGYGQTGCIIFRPPLSEIKAYEDGDCYEVNITGDAQTVSYTVNFFNLKTITLDKITAEYKGTSIEEGGTLNPSDFIVTGFYSDGSKKKLTDFTIQPYKITAGNNDITIQYQGKTAVVKVTGTASKITIQFDAAGGSAVLPRTIEKGSVLAPIPSTTRIGYLFEGWYTAPEGGTKLEVTTVLDKDATFYAHWKAVELSHLEAKALFTRLIEGEDYEYEPDDFLVTAVYTDGSRRTVKDYTIDEHTITAGENTLTIRYGGKSVDVKVNAVAVLSFYAMYIGVPKTEGTTQLDDTDLRLMVKLSDGDTITVRYPDYTIDPFVIRPGENILTVRFGGKSQTFIVTGLPKEEGKILTGITVRYMGGSIPVQGEIDRTQLTVTASYSDGSAQTISDYVLADYVIKEGDNTITVSYQGKSAEFHVTGVTEDIRMVTVRFDAQGGSMVTNRTIAKGSAVGDLPETERNGYLFEGWYTQAKGGTQVTKHTLVQEDATYYAHWKINTVDKPDVPDIPDKPDTPDVPDKPDTPDVPDIPDTDTPDVPDKPDTPDIPDKPDTPSETVMVIFDAQGGASVDPISMDKYGRLSYIPVTYQSGRIFQGWYTGRNGTGSLLTLGTQIEKDMVYYACWTAADRTASGIEAAVYGTVYAGESAYHALTVRVRYSDGTTETIYDYAVSQQVLQAGNNLIQVNWNGFTTSVRVQAGANTANTNIRSITAVYNGGDLPVGTYTVFAGLTVKAVLYDGTEREVNNYALSGNSIRQGQNIVTVHYEGRTANFLVTGYQHLSVSLHADVVSDIWVARGTDLDAALKNNYPVREGYQFLGWYLDADLSQRVTAGTAVSDGMQLYAKWRKLDNWKLNKTKAVVKKGRTLKLFVQGLKNEQITWKTSNKRIAAVSKKGVVKAKKAGTAIITAVTSDGSVMTCSIKVRKK